MFKKNRILENRIFAQKGDVYGKFEKKIINALYLERKIFMRKFPKIEQYQSRTQYIVFLVSCLEYFLSEMFKESINKKVINFEAIKDFKRFKSMRFGIKDLEEINKNKIKISEILVEEMNFQNMEDILFLCDLLKLEKNFEEIISTKKDFEFPKIKNRIQDGRVKNFPKAEKELTRFILRSFGTVASIPKDMDTLIRMLNTIKKMIILRHKIVHKAHVIKIENWESLAYTMSTFQLAYLLYESYKIEKTKA